MTLLFRNDLSFSEMNRNQLFFYHEPVPSNIRKQNIFPRLKSIVKYIIYSMYFIDILVIKYYE